MSDIPDDIDDIIQEEDGPQIPEGTPPAKENSAKRLRKHHEEHTRHESKSAEDQVKQVDRHNKAYPKLETELDKRKSIAEPRMKSTQVSRLDGLCRRCASRKAAKNKRLRSRIVNDRRRRRQSVARGVTKMRMRRQPASYRRRGGQRERKDMKRDDMSTSSEHLETETKKSESTTNTTVESRDSFGSMADEPMV